MANIVRFLQALASGLQEFQSVRSGVFPVTQVSEDHVAFDGDRLTVDNPWMPEDQAHALERVCGSAVSSFSVAATYNPGSVFLAARDLLVTSALVLARADGLTRDDTDRALLFELARTANRLFSEDTESDEMWALDSNLTYSRDKIELLLSNEVHAFMDAAFTGDLERAVKVADAVASLGVQTYKKPDDDRAVLESQMRRSFAGLVLMEMSGTLSAQVTPDLIVDLDDRPIGGGAQSDPFAQSEDD